MRTTLVLVALAACGNTSDKQAVPAAGSGSAAPAPLAAKPVDAAAPAAPFCFASNQNDAWGVVQLAGTTLTVCRKMFDTKALTCANVALADGRFTAAPAPAPPASAALATISTDGTREVALVPERQDVELRDAKTHKRLSTIRVHDSTFKCLLGAGFLGNTIYVTADRCGQAPGVAWLFTSAGQPIGKLRDSISFQGETPFHDDGDTWLIHDFESDDVLVLDVKTGAERKLEITSADHCCPLARGTDTIAPFVKQPDGTVIAIGSVISVLDIAAGKIVRTLEVPACPEMAP